MSDLVQDLVLEAAQRWPQSEAIRYQQASISYRQLADAVTSCCQTLLCAGLGRSERVAIYAEKRVETAVALFAIATTGGVFVPVNPLLKADQVAHILIDCDAVILITTAERLVLLIDVLPRTLRTIIVIGESPRATAPDGIQIVAWNAGSSDDATPLAAHRVIDADMAAILYTSGSTGKPKGVVLSHRNIVAGARSVAGYLRLDPGDRLLAVLPLSFDYGLNQLTSAFLVGASVVLMNYLFPRDIVNLVCAEKITGLAAVPPLWIQLAQLQWPATVSEHLRFITNSGGTLPTATLALLRRALPGTTPYLMYGLTEAFRSTFLPPEELDGRPDSIGKAIPNAEVLVVREDGSLCEPNEPGELVHRGALVSLGYWNDAERTTERFRPFPGQDPGLPITEMAVWSGDTVRRDEDGFLYFLGRRDEMIKTSGYRVGPAEIEEVVYGISGVGESVAIGVPHPVLGQAIAVLVTPAGEAQLTAEVIKAECQRRLPSFMVPAHVEILLGSLPRNPNGKIDRKQLASQRQHIFENS